MIYQPSCQGVTFVSPSPPAGGTPCRNYKPLLVDKSCHLSDPINTTDSLDESSTLSVSDDYLLHLDTGSPSSELQTNSTVDCVKSSVDCVEIELLTESEGQLGHANHSPTDIFHEHHDYELFLLRKVIDAPYDNLSHQDTHICEEQNLYDILIHANILSHTFALPHLWHKSQRCWSLGSEKYMKSAINYIKQCLEAKGSMLKTMVAGVLPSGRQELDVSPAYNNEDANYFHQQIGVLHWIVKVGCIDICAEISMLASFSPTPRERHLAATFHVFTYLKGHGHS